MGLIRDNITSINVTNIAEARSVQLDEFDFRTGYTSNHSLNGTINLPASTTTIDTPLTTTSDGKILVYWFHTRIDAATGTENIRFSMYISNLAGTPITYLFNDSRESFAVLKASAFDKCAPFNISEYSINGRINLDLTFPVPALIWSDRKVKIKYEVPVGGATTARWYYHVQRDWNV